MRTPQLLSPGMFGPVALATVLAIGCTSDSVSPTRPEGDGAISAQAATSGAPTTAVMRFGNPTVGTTRFGPEHPSAHARDNIIPTTVVIRAGGTVTFEVGVPHTVAIYQPGTKPEDIRLIPGVTVFDHVGPPGPPFIPNFYIDEPIGRLFIDPAPAFGAPHTLEYTFDDPGRYLVICAVFPHFAFWKMYGWVEVK